MAFEASAEYLAASVFRFAQDLAEPAALQLFERLVREPEGSFALGAQASLAL